MRKCDKLNACMCPCTRAHYASMRARVLNSTVKTALSVTLGSTRCHRRLQAEHNFVHPKNCVSRRVLSGGKSRVDSFLTNPPLSLPRTVLFLSIPTLPPPLDSAVDTESQAASLRSTANAFSYLLNKIFRLRRNAIALHIHLKPHHNSLIPTSFAKPRPHCILPKRNLFPYYNGSVTAVNNSICCCCGHYCYCRCYCPFCNLLILQEIALPLITGKFNGNSAFACQIY